MMIKRAVSCFDIMRHCKVELHILRSYAIAVALYHFCAPFHGQQAELKLLFHLLVLILTASVFTLDNIYSVLSSRKNC